MSQRVTDEDGHIVESFPLPTDENTLERLLRGLFEAHWDKLVFGPNVAQMAPAPTCPSYQPAVDGSSGLRHDA